MNSVTFSRRASACSCGAQLGLDLEAQLRAAVVGARRARPVGGQLQRLQPGQLLAPVGQLALAGTAACSRSRCQARSRRTGSAAAAAGRALPRQNAAYSAPSSRASTSIDQPSETMWCTTTSSTCSCGARRSSRARSNGARDRSKGSSPAAQPLRQCRLGRQRLGLPGDSAQRLPARPHLLHRHAIVSEARCAAPRGALPAQPAPSATTAAAAGPTGAGPSRSRTARWARATGR